MRKRFYTVFNIVKQMDDIWYIKIESIFQNMNIQQKLQTFIIFKRAKSSPHHRQPKTIRKYRKNKTQPTPTKKQQTLPTQNFSHVPRQKTRDPIQTNLRTAQKQTLQTSTDNGANFPKASTSWNVKNHARKAGAGKRSFSRRHPAPGVGTRLTTSHCILCTIRTPYIKCVSFLRILIFVSIWFWIESWIHIEV